LTSRTGTSFEERVGQVLVEAGFITDDQLGQARVYGDEKGGSLLDNLMTLGIVARETLVTVLSFQLRIPIFDLKNQDVDPDAVRLIPEEFAREHRILPVSFEPDGSLRVATLMPNDFQLST
jgi:type IV pilus assembly protein PilB